MFRAYSFQKYDSRPRGQFSLVLWGNPQSNRCDIQRDNCRECSDSFLCKFWFWFDSELDTGLSYLHPSLTLTTSSTNIQLEIILSLLSIEAAAFLEVSQPKLGTACLSFSSQSGLTIISLLRRDVRRI
jgi:uncharacterized Zn-finger protein